MGGFGLILGYILFSVGIVVTFMTAIPNKERESFLSADSSAMLVQGGDRTSYSAKEKIQ